MPAWFMRAHVVAGLTLRYPSPPPPQERSPHSADVCRLHRFLRFRAPLPSSLISYRRLPGPAIAVLSPPAFPSSLSGPLVVSPPSRCVRDQMRSKRPWSLPTCQIVGVSSGDFHARGFLLWADLLTVLSNPARLPAGPSPTPL